jgi:PAS domain S-box-containing protein
VIAERRLRDSEQRFRLMADAVLQIVWITDAAGQVEFFNRHWFDYTSAIDEPATAAEIAARFVHPEDAALTAAAFDASRHSGTTYTVEHRIRSASGAYRWFLVRGEPYRDPTTGEVVRWFGASVDIHDRKVAEAALRELNDTLEQRVEAALAERKFWADVSESADALIAALAPGHRFLAANKAYLDEFQRIYGMRPKVGDCLLDLLAGMPEHRDAALAIWDRALAGEEFTSVQEFGNPERARPYYTGGPSH